MINISEKLKSLRKGKGYTMQTVSNKTGIAFRTYQNYEYGNREISTEALCKLADFYGITTDYLLGRNQSNSDDQLTPKQIEDYIRLRDLNPVEERLLRAYIALPENIRVEIMEFLKKAVTDKENLKNS